MFIDIDEFNAMADKSELDDLDEWVKGFREWLDKHTATTPPGPSTPPPVIGTWRPFQPAPTQPKDPPIPLPGPVAPASPSANPFDWDLSEFSEWDFTESAPEKWAESEDDLT